MSELPEGTEGHGRASDPRGSDLRSGDPRSGDLPSGHDKTIIDRLAVDGRCSITDLARLTGLSVSAVHQRVKRLEERRIISGYSARLDPVALGLPMTAFVSITPLDPAAPDDAPEKLAGLTAIEACHSVAGAESYILKVRVPDPMALEVLLQQIRAQANVLTRTTVVLSTPYEHRPILGP